MEYIRFYNNFLFFWFMIYNPWIIINISILFCFWLAEGNGQFIENGTGGVIPLALRESPGKDGSLYTFASADPRIKACENITYDLTRLVDRLKDLSPGLGGKSTVLLNGQRNEKATPESISGLIREVYKI